jgi:hypothetical protein
VTGMTSRLAMALKHAVAIQFLQPAQNVLIWHSWTIREELRVRSSPGSGGSTTDAADEALERSRALCIPEASMSLQNATVPGGLRPARTGTG